MDRSYKVSKSLPTRLLDEGPRANERLTASLAVVLLVLLALEGATLLVMRQAVALHIFLGMVLVAVVAIKTGSTTYRFARFYMGSEPYRRRGPPALIPRLLGPVVVVLTAALLATGVALLAIPAGPSSMLTLHKVVFVLWFGAMAVHVLIHVIDLPGAGLADWRSDGGRLSGAVGRRSLLVAGLLLGVVLGVALLPAAGAWAHYLAGGGGTG
ncbi:MAG: hypothetical protein WBU92_05205 [Candidatus Dormiibacterota bacterium]